MAVHDRDYMRRGRPLFGAPDRLWTAATWLVAAHVAGTFVAEAAAGWFRADAAPWLALSWDGLRGGRVWTVLSHPFVGRLSWGWAVTALVVWFLVRRAEDDMGRLRTAAFLAIAAVAGSVVHAAAFAAGAGQRFGPDLSYGLAALGTAAVVHAAARRPSEPVRVIFLTIPLWAVAAAWTLAHLTAFVRPASAAGGDVWLHVGSLLWGLTSGALGGVPDLDAWLAARARRRRIADADRALAAREDVQQRVDALLERIHAEGIDSLTEEERRFLNEASRRYR